MLSMYIVSFTFKFVSNIPTLYFLSCLRNYVGIILHSTQCMWKRVSLLTIGTFTNTAVVLSIYVVLFTLLPLSNLYPTAKIDISLIVNCWFITSQNELQWRVQRNMAYVLWNFSFSRSLPYIKIRHIEISNHIQILSSEPTELQ